MSKKRTTRKKSTANEGSNELKVKVFLVEGSYREKGKIILFKKEVRAVQQEHAKEHILRELGSRHRIKMRNISFSKITEIDPTNPEVELKDPIVSYLSSDDATKLTLPTR